MKSDNFALKVLGLEFLAITACGISAFLFVRATNEAARKKANVQEPAPVTQAPAINVQTFAAQYQKEGKSVSDLISALQLRPQTDLIEFVVDTSQSMDDDRQELKENIKKIMARNRGKGFVLVDFADTALVRGEATRNAAELQQLLDDSRDLGGTENCYNALVIAAAKAHEKFKYPAIILMTDAAPNDGRLGSGSRVTIKETAEALNAADAELHVLVAFDYQEFLAGGAAATSDAYPELLKSIRAGGKVHLLKRVLDPNSRTPTVR